ncbi:alpha/beta hydrolase [Paenarthrobacter histidinolovorans]|uniref:Pimeloyl-ACP methyl ester carboxylesterase n=1 Tax=Paenarthrobacter histidinolovorans TaxID=43664 RepID=A0ABW8NA71_9MICC|nr:alpha/beta hydrolase [Paenarthrobacter histidinolovorans]GGJ30575.1 alpha/beta hydrolase [Paenarthrobacter histidinolovorans]
MTSAPRRPAGNPSRDRSAQLPAGGAVRRGAARRGIRSRGFAAMCVALASLLVLSACTVPFLPAPTAKPSTSTVDPSIAASAPKGLEKFYSQSVEWSSCGDGLQCGKVRVPMDYAQPGSEEITLAAIKLPSTGDKKGSILVNPGGPGGSGVDFIKDAGTTHFTEKLRANYDVVGFDPRGVKDSAPVKCMTDAERDAAREKVFRKNTDEGLAAAIAFNKSFAEQCAQQTGPVLGHIDTVSAAKDLDILRAVVNDAKLNYLGFSYGTFLGSTYASLFPDNVGHLVLDGAVDPSISNEELTAGQAKAFEKAIHTYVASCQKQNQCPMSGSVENGVQEIRDLISAVDENPQTAKDGRLVTGNDFVNGLILPLYNDQSWPALTQALDSAFSGDVSQMMRLADLGADREPNGTYSSNSAFAFQAINCLDYPMVMDTAGMRAEEARLIQDSPTFGAFFAYGGVNCKDWPYPNTRTPAPVKYSGEAPIVVVGTTGDPATPLEWSQSLRKQLENASLVTWQGEGHTAYGRSNSCVSSAVDDYFVDGKLPQDGLTC